MKHLTDLITPVGLALMIAAGLSINAHGKDFSDMPVEWALEPIAVDGQMADWSDLSTRFLGEPKAVIGLACDSTHLYLMLRFQDNRWAQIITRTGLKLWLDPNGKKKEIFMIKFHGGPTPEQMQSLDGDGRGPGGGRNPEDRPGGDRRLFSCAIKDRIEEKSIPVDGTEGPQAAFGLDQGFFVYEVSIPLDEGGVRYYGFGARPGDEVSVGVFWGALGEMLKRSDRPGGGMPGGGMGGGRGGMGGGPPGGGRGCMRGGDRPERPEPVEFWIKTTLAGQAESE